MDKTILKQALKFCSSTPTYSQIEKLYKVAQSYQSENNVFFIQAKYRGKAELLNKELFFEFLSDAVLGNGTIKCFEDIEKILSAETRKENIEASGDSKNSITKVFDRIVVLQKNDGHPVLYKDLSDIEVSEQLILAVENGETFLNIYSLMSKFGFTHFIYLGGFSNTLTREFLKDKDVVFYLDFDIEAIRIYDSFTCKNKSFFQHPDIEKYFKSKKHRNKKLYLKQRVALPHNHTELQWLIRLIKKYSAVVEQEIFT